MYKIFLLFLGKKEGRKLFKKDIEKIKNKILNMLKENYKNYEIRKECLSLLHEGQFANAAVFRYNDENNLDITIKDFSGSPWLVRKTLGRIFVNIEGHTMMKLENNPSITKGVVFLSPCTLAFNFIKGKAIKEFQEKEIPKDFFITLEKNVKEMHRRNIVHLDLRNLGNVIMSKEGYPYIIDFQSCISTKHLPKKLRKILRASDLTGVYKCWNRRCSEPLDEEREEFFNEFQKIRKLWVLKGYPVQRFIRHTKEKFSQKKSR